MADRSDRLDRYQDVLGPDPDPAQRRLVADLIRLYDPPPLPPHLRATPAWLTATHRGTASTQPGVGIHLQGVRPRAAGGTRTGAGARTIAWATGALLLIGATIILQGWGTNPAPTVQTPPSVLPVAGGPATGTPRLPVAPATEIVPLSQRPPTATAALPSAMGTAVVTLPPAAAGPTGDVRAARLTFTPSLALPAFTALIRAVGVVPVQVGLITYESPDQIHAEDISSEEGPFSLLYLNQVQPKGRIGWAVVQLDRSQADRLQAQAGMALDMGPGGWNADSAEPVIARWRAAAQALNRVQMQMQMECCGTGPPVPAGASVEVEAVYDRLQADSRFRVTLHEAGGDRILLWDGQHAYDYRGATQELYRPAGDPASAPLGTEEIASELAWVDSSRYYLQPGRATYTLVGTRQVAGRTVTTVQVIASPMGPGDLPVNAQVDLDPTTALPYRVELEHGATYTYQTLIANAPLPAAAFTPEFPSVRATIYADPDGRQYPSVAAAAAAVDFTLYAPRGQENAQVRVVYEVEQNGRRSPVVQFQGLNLVEGRYLPAAESDFTPIPTTIAGEPALRQGPQVTITRGETQIQITESLFQGQPAETIIRELVPVH